MRFASFVPTSPKAIRIAAKKSMFFMTPLLLRVLENTTPQDRYDLVVHAGAASVISRKR
jgi:hypothetical protein